MRSIKRTVFTLLALLLSAAFSVYGGNSFSHSRQYVPENAKWVIHLDFKALTGTNLWKKIYRNNEFKFDKGKNDFLKDFNFDIVNDLNAVSIYGTRKGSINTDTGVVLLSGKFDRAKIIARLVSEKKPKKSRYLGSEIFHWNGDDFGCFVLDSLMVITHSQTVMESALDTIKRKKPGFSSSPLSARLKDVPRDAVLFAFTGDLPDLIGKHNRSPIMIDKAGMAMFLVMEKNNDMRLSLKLHTESAEAAKNILQVGNGLLALARMSGNEDKDEMRILQTLNIAAKGDTVTAELLIPQDLIIKNID